MELASIKRKFLSCTAAALLAINMPVFANTSRPVKGDWLLYRLGAEPHTLNPVTASDAYESMINAYILETLIERNKDTLELEPRLAERYEISPDYLEFTYYLRKDVKWHDGHPFTAEDVIFSYEKIIDPKTDAPHRKHYYRDIENVIALDDYTVRFKYKKPYFLALELTGGMPIVPKHVLENGDFNKHSYGRHPIGTGPYKFVEWKTGSKVVLERNEGYWGEEPYLDKIIYRIITDNVVALQALKKGDLDTSGLTPIQWARQSDSKRFKDKLNKFNYYLPNFSFIGWNADTPFFEDKEVRKAMTHLINRKGILNGLMFNLARQVTGPFYINSPEYTAFEPYEYDPEKAKQLLDEAGWIDSNGNGIRDKKGMEFNFEFLISSGSQFAEQLATILKEDLKYVGIEMRIRRLEWSVFTQHLNERKFDATTLGWSLGVEQDPYQIWHSSQADHGSNFVGFRNEEADRIIEVARAEFDKEKRIKLYHRLNEIINEEQPYTFLFCYPSLAAVSKRFQEVNVYKLGLDLKEWWVPLELQKY